MAKKWDDVLAELGNFTPDTSFDNIESFVKDNNDFVLAGQPGPASGVSSDLENKYGKRVKCFVPMGPGSINKPNELAQANPGEIDWHKEKVIVASYHAFEVGRKLMADYDLEYLSDYLFFDHVYLLNNPLFHNSAGAPFYEYFTQHQNDFEVAYNLLSDELSRTTYAKLLNFRSKAFRPDLMTFEDLPTPLEVQYEYEKNASLFSEFVPKKVPSPLREDIAFKLSLDAYSYLDIISPENKKVILNIGAYNNSSAPLALVARGGLVYAFEPQADKHADNVVLAKIFPEIIPVPKGVWKETTRLSFTIDESATGGTTASYVSAVGNIQIDAVSIDDFANENHIEPDFIKMDTEGAELEALEGG